MSFTSTPPTLIPRDDCDRLLLLETDLCETAGSLLSQGYAEEYELNHALNGVVLANTLLWEHQSSRISDEEPHHAAEQLKCYFLAKIELLIHL